MIKSQVLGYFRCPIVVLAAPRELYAPPPFRLKRAHSHELVIWLEAHVGAGSKHLIEYDGSPNCWGSLLLLLGNAHIQGCCGPH